MDRSRLSDLAHARHPIAAPLSDVSVDRLLALLVVGGRSVLDLGCGDGSWLLRALRLDPGVMAVGVDLSGQGFDRVRRQAEQEGLGDRLELVRADARSWTADERFDVVLSVGASHAFGGAGPTLAAMAGHLRPGGQALLGEAFWERAPGPETLEVLGMRADELQDLAGTVALAADAGWNPLEGHVSTLEEWDDYEWSWTSSLSRWALEHPDDPDAAEVARTATEHREGWLAGYRGTLGFLTLLLARA